MPEKEGQIERDMATKTDRAKEQHAEVKDEERDRQKDNFTGINTEVNSFIC